VTSAGRFSTLDSYPSLNRYTYGQGDPINTVDPTGHWPSVGTCITIGIIAVTGALFAGAATVCYNRALGFKWNENLARNMAIGAGLALLAWQVPALAYALGVFGIAQGAAVAIETWTNPNTTWDQRIAAAAFALLMGFGGYKGIQYGSAALAQGRLFGVLQDVGEVIVQWLAALRPPEPAELSPAVIAQLAEASQGETMTVYTRLSSAPQPGRQLHVASKADITGGVAGAGNKQLYVGRIPKLIWARLMLDGEIEPANLEMGGMRGTQYLIKPSGVDYVLEYFSESQ
jgi:hypothetical protein